MPISTLLLQNRYRLDSELGRGGMGVVYRAHDTLLDRPVAVKVLNQAGLGAEGRARLLHEARAAAQLDHPNIVSIYDAGESGDSLFIVMQLVEGHSLHERPLQSPAEILALARQICAALEHAHAHGIIHRDLKPENILLGADGAARLTDFGLARSAAARQAAEGPVGGTVFYMAPEQALGQAVDARADLYALGVVLYELVAGRLPFSGDDPLLVLSQHLRASPAPPGAFNPHAPPALERIILKLLAKQPADRFASAPELLAALSEASPDAGPRHNLPLLISSFVGREREVEAVRQSLDAYRLVTLTGAGGSGKTRLALQAAAGLLESFADGVWLAELASLSDPALVPQVVLSALNARALAGRSPLEALVAYLRSRRLLLVLDNCEHLIEACARLLDTLLRACPRLRVLAVSREAIGLTGERAFPVPSLSVPLPHDLPPAGEALLAALAGSEAVRLFVDRAAAVQPGFALSAQNGPLVAQICRRLDGMPLAIELAAARLRTLSLEQIAARLGDRFSLLTVGSRAALPRHQTLRATIDWSYDLLSESERCLFRRLSVFAGGWTLEAAEAVCPGRDGRLRPSQILETQSRLVDKSLVLLESRAGETRYHFLDTIRQYASDRLREAGELEAAQARHLEHFLRLAEAAEPHLRDAEQITWLERLQVEHDNLRAALDGALRPSAGPVACLAGLQLAGHLYRYWYLRGYWSEGRDWLARALAASGDAGAELPAPGAPARDLWRARARALQGCGWLADETAQARAPYERSLALCRVLDDKWGAAFSLRGLGAMFSDQNDNAQAAGLLAESLALFRELDDAWGVALALFNLGWVSVYQDERQQAEARWEEGLALFQQTGDRWGVAVTLGSLGFFARLQSDYKRATELWKQTLALYQQLGDEAGIGMSLSRLGNVAYRRDELEQAATLLEEGLPLLKKLGQTWSLGYSIAVLGHIACLQGDYARAAARIEEGLALLREGDDAWGFASGLDFLAQTAWHQGDFERAVALWQDSLDRFRALSDTSGMASALAGLGQTALRQGDYLRAAALLGEGLALARQARDKPILAAALVSLGRLAAAQADRAQAAALFKESLALRGELSAKRGIAEALEGLAGLAAAESQPQRAALLLGAAEALRQTSGAPVPPVERGDFDRLQAGVRAALGEAEAAVAWAAGRALKVEQVIAAALEDSPT